MRLRIPALVLCAAACGESFDPPSLITDLRVLAVRAEPPEIAPLARGEDGEPLEPQPDGRPPDRATLTALVADPRFAEAPRPITLVYLACTPEPAAVEASVCELVETYADPARLPELLAAGALECEPGGGGATTPGVGITGGVSFSGIEVCDHAEGCAPATVEIGGAEIPLPPPTYVLPEDFSLDALPAGHHQRTTGVQVLTVAIAVAASPAEIVEGADPADGCAFVRRVADNLGRLIEERDRMTVIKRVAVRGPDNADEPNVNPRIAALFARGRPLPEAIADPPQPEAVFARRAKVELRPGMPADAEGKPIPTDVLFQRYTRYDAEGNAFRGEREAWVWSWFTTAGAFERERTRAFDQEQIWTAPGDADHPLPESGRVFLYTVLRDARGGIDWIRREVRID